MVALADTPGFDDSRAAKVSQEQLKQEVVEQEELRRQDENKHRETLAKSVLRGEDEPPDIRI